MAYVLPLTKAASGRTFYYPDAKDSITIATHDSHGVTVVTHAVGFIGSVGKSRRRERYGKHLRLPMRSRGRSDDCSNRSRHSRDRKFFLQESERQSGLPPTLVQKESQIDTNDKWRPISSGTSSLCRDCGTRAYRPDFRASLIRKARRRYFNWRVCLDSAF
jgi:hypothetical protein